MSNQIGLEKLKEEMSLLAERIAKEGFGITLDYSPESIRQVEQILESIHKDYKKTHSEEGLYGIAFEFGAYIVQVIERNFGTAKWERNHKSIGENTFPLYWQNSTLFPVEWCRKRIFDGSGDNVWMKFRIHILNAVQRNTEINP